MKTNKNIFCYTLKSSTSSLKFAKVAQNLNFLKTVVATFSLTKVLKGEKS